MARHNGIGKMGSPSGLPIFNIVVIGLEKRKDRWQRCEEIFKKEGIEKVTHYVTQKDEEDPYRNYMRDFLDMLRLKRGSDLMFFEDDFEFTDNWKEVLVKAWSELPEDWDMLYLGANLTNKVLPVSEHLVKVRGAWLMHATILRAKFIDYILEHYNYDKVRIIDEWYRKKAMAKNFYMTVPMISYQRVDHSDFVGKTVNYDIFENRYYLKTQK